MPPPFVAPEGSTFKFLNMDAGDGTTYVVFPTDPANLRALAEIYQPTLMIDIGGVSVSPGVYGAMHFSEALAVGGDVPSTEAEVCGQQVALTPVPHHAFQIASRSAHDGWIAPDELRVAMHRNIEGPPYFYGGPN